MTLYLNEEHELVKEIPENLASDVQVEINSYYGNSEIEYIFSTPISINGWHLRSLTIYRKWNDSFLKKVMVYKDQMAMINIIEIIRNSRFFAGEKWFNRGNTELGLNSMILRKVISFLETIPSELKSKKGVELYIAGLRSINMNDLSQFYKELLNSRQMLSESDIRFLEDYFANKMYSLLAD